MGRTALFVIDIQNEMAGNAKTEIPTADRIREAGTKILETSRGLVAPSGTQPALIVFVQHEEKPENGSLVRGTEPWKLVFNPNEGAKDEILVAKTHCDTFESNPQLAERLKKDGIDHIVAFGLQSEHCVKSTSKGAIDAGFKLTLLQGAHSTYDDGDTTALDIEKQVDDFVSSLGGKLVPWQDAVSTWQKSGVVC